MPTFPKYHGECPECLNPWRPHHWALLLSWVFFRPSGLKYYLYQADPELYRSGRGSKAIFKTWRNPTYRNLYITAVFATVILAVLAGGIYTAITGWLIDTSVVDWSGWLYEVLKGVVFGVMFGVVFGIVFGVVGGVAGGVAVGVSIGAVVGVTFGVAIGVAIGVAGITFGVTGDATIAIIAGIAGGIGIGIEVSSAYGVVPGILYGIAGGISFGIAFDIALEVVGGGVGSFIGGAALGVAFSITLSVALGVATGVAAGVALGIVFGVVGSFVLGFGVFVGSTHLLFYPFQVVLALCYKFPGVRHPLEWDEFVVLPLPWSQNFLEQSFPAQCTRTLLKSPFQRRFVHSASYRYVHSHDFPLQVFYLFLTHPSLNEYVTEPMESIDWERNISIRRLLLGRLGLQLAKTNRGIEPAPLEHFLWWMVLHLRKRRHTTLTRFAEMLYELLDERTVDAEKFRLSSYDKVYSGVLDYPGGEEIARTFESMASFLSYTTLQDVCASPKLTDVLIFDEPIRPTVLDALRRLGEVGAEVQVHRDSTSRANKLAALARAADALKDLDEFVLNEVMAPEQYLLRRIIRQWQVLLIDAGGKLGRAELAGPVANPYVVGNPVTGDLFVGREDILRRLEELWRGYGQKPSVVLYGHRRMGKSSILHNLGARFGKATVIVDFNMQRVGMVEQTGELLYNLSLAMYDALEIPLSPPLRKGENEEIPLNPPLIKGEKEELPFSPPLRKGESEEIPLNRPLRKGKNEEIPLSPPLRKGEIWAEPEEGNFLKHNPYTAFDRFLRQVDRVRGERRLIITVDEFELIEEMITQGILEARLLDFWRSLIQTYPWFVMAFAGLHTLQEMTRDYWNPLFGSVTGIPVSFLNESAARQLITQPSADFDLDYDQVAIDEIFRLTHGQPYLVQLICHCLVSRFNRQTFEEGTERERWFRLADVEAVIASPTFFRDGDAYFTGVWQQAEDGDSPNQRAVLQTIAAAKGGMTLETLVAQSGIDQENVVQALNILRRHDVVTETDLGWRFTVELMRRWVLISNSK